jgi:diguanylate cyclase (GGDEF)-like protein
MASSGRVVSDPSLGHRLARAFMAVGSLIAATLIITGACFAAVLGHYEPTIHELLAGADAINQAHVGMLDEETGLRGFIITGDAQFLAPYYQGEQELLAGDTTALVLATHPDLVGAIVTMRVAQEDWISSWATPALTFANAHSGAPTVESFLLSGKNLFDAYRTTNSAVSTAVDQDIAGEQTQEHDIVLIALALAAALLALSVVVARRNHRALRTALVVPINDLLDTMRQVAAGDLTARPRGVGPPELRDVATELARMTDVLAAERLRITAVEAEASSQAARLGLIVNVGREITGSLSLRYVAESVSKAALTISGFATARMWMIDDDRRELTSVYQTHVELGPTVDRDSLQLGEGLVGRAGQFGRTLSTRSDGSLATEYNAGAAVAALALPMIVGARIVGVLELTTEESARIDESSLDVLHSLAGQAATAVEAARFHERADEMSHTDVLTRMPNRRRLELDLEMETARSQRYNRPVAFIMLDVDHFKEVNDTHGHQAGDEILSEFKTAFTAALRETDTAYRFGGEEFCVLLRETDADAASVVAERIRAAIAVRFAGNLGTSMVTASFGVAAIPHDAVDGKTLIAAADQALYAAKAAGRNCVVRAPSIVALEAITPRGRGSRLSPDPSSMQPHRMPVLVADEPVTP